MVITRRVGDHVVNKIRVAITGMSMVTPFGSELSTNWDALVNGKMAYKHEEDLSDFESSVIARCPNYELPPEYFSKIEASRLSKSTRIGFLAAYNALKQANLLENNFSIYDKEEVPVVLGVSGPDLNLVEKANRALDKGGVRRVNPFWLPNSQVSMPANYISMKLGLMGGCFITASACASSGHSIISSIQLIESGRASIVVTGGADANCFNSSIGGFESMKATVRNKHLDKKVSRPFDKNREGFIFGEGGAVLIFENYDTAISRGADILGLVEGFGMSSDAYKLTSPLESGYGASLGMTRALKDAGLSPTDISYINTHGTGTPIGDVAETNSIKKAFGDHAHNINCTSSKSMTGHCMGAAAAIESVITIMSLKTGIVTPTINLSTMDESCDLNYTPNRFVKLDGLRYGLNNSFGFGGTNTSIIFSKP